MFFNVDGVCSRISSSDASQGAHRQCFLVLMVGALGSLASLSLRGPTIDDFNVDGGRSRIYSSGTSQGAHRRYFLALMVDTLRSTYPTPSRGPAINVS
jgi:hypothetical protein